MSRTKKTRQVRASQMAGRLSTIAKQMRPLARSTKAAAMRAVHRTRAWGAPRVEHTGQAVQDSIAPKVASSLSSVAQRLDPGKPRSARWRRPAWIAAVTAAASAVAAVVRHRSKTGSGSPPAEQTDQPPTTEIADKQAPVSADADGRATTS